MQTQTIDANGIQICYEDRPGPHSDSPVLVLIMGLGCQLLHWPEYLVAHLNAHCRVIRFDNRDMGHSSWMKGMRVKPSSAWDLARWLFGARLPSPYTLNDMAADTIGLMDALNLPQAHIIGASMGGMIAQIIGYEYPERVQSLSLIMTTSGKRSKGLPRQETLKKVMTPPPSREFEDVLRTAINSWKGLQGHAHPTPPEQIEARLRAILERAQNPAGFLRQNAAIMNQPDRSPQLRTITAPTLVLHGEDDPLVGVSGGRHLASVIPGAKLITIPGWGHDFPESVREIVGDALLAHAGLETAVAA